MLEIVCAGFVGNGGGIVDTAPTCNSPQSSNSSTCGCIMPLLLTHMYICIVSQAYR